MTIPAQTLLFAALPSRQRGAALFVAIFLISVVVLAAGIVALTSVTQHTGQARAALADGAWYAAVARLETDIPGILSSGTCPATADQDLFGFTTTLTCQRSEVAEGATSYAVFTLEASAFRGNQARSTLVRRTAQAQVTDRTEP